MRFLKLYQNTGSYRQTELITKLDALLSLRKTKQYELDTEQTKK
jgi:hypothetical protein